MPHLLLIADLVVSTLILSAVVFARASGAKRIWKLFWAGFLIGLVVEAGFFLDGPFFSSRPVYQLQAAFPIHPALQPLAHSVWDGGLFLAGVGIVGLLCRAPTFQRFRLAELLVFILWGNIQEVIVEMVAISSGLWTFIAGPYNVCLFSFGSGAITLLPQLVWTIGPIIYYLILLHIIDVQLCDANCNFAQPDSEQPVTRAASYPFFGQGGEPSKMLKAPIVGVEQLVRSKSQFWE